MDLRPYELRDPQGVMDQIAAREQLRAGHAYLALVAHPSTEQRVVRVDPLRTPAVIHDEHEACEELREVVDRWPLPPREPLPTHQPILVVARTGRCVLGSNEGVWLMALRYLNPPWGLWSGDLIVVTEHGWAHLMTDWGGVSPALTA